MKNVNVNKLPKFWNQSTEATVMKRCETANPTQISATRARLLSGLSSNFGMQGVTEQMMKAHVVRPSSSNSAAKSQTMTAT